MTRPLRKRFGQHLLSNPNTINNIVKAIYPKKNDKLVEIGPGRGAITIPILKNVGELHNYLYDYRNIFSHIQKETKLGRRESRMPTNKKKRQMLVTALEMLRQSSETMVNSADTMSNNTSNEGPATAVSRPTAPLAAGLRRTTSLTRRRCCGINTAARKANKPARRL